LTQHLSLKHTRKHMAYYRNCPGRKRRTGSRTESQWKFLPDIHEFGEGNVKAADVEKVHQKDLTVQNKYGVHFINYWVTRKGYCDLFIAGKWCFKWSRYIRKRMGCCRWRLRRCYKANNWTAGLSFYDEVDIGKVLRNRPFSCLPNEK
jgi:hypothetical protein